MTTANVTTYGTIYNLSRDQLPTLIDPPQKVTSVSIGTFFGQESSSTAPILMSKAIYTGSGGSVTVMFKDGSTFQFASLNSGIYLPVMAVKVTASTVAAGLGWAM